MAIPGQPPTDVADAFYKHWQTATDDSNLTLHGFRRFKTTHLLNLRFLEDEIARKDRLIYQAGLSLHCDRPPRDRLGLNNSKRDQPILDVETTITQEFVLDVRNLLKQYGA